MADVKTKAVTVPTVKGGEITVQVPDNGNTAKSGSTAVDTHDRLQNARDARKAPPAGETKSQKWKRLANARGYKAIKAIRAIGGLSSTVSYDYNDESANKLMEVLGNELKALAQRFTSKEKKDVPTSIF